MQDIVGGIVCGAVASYWIWNFLTLLYSRVESPMSLMKSMIAIIMGMVGFGLVLQEGWSKIGMDFQPTLGIILVAVSVFYFARKHFR